MIKQIKVPSSSANSNNCNLSFNRDRSFRDSQTSVFQTGQSLSSNRRQRDANKWDRGWITMAAMRVVQREDIVSTEIQLSYELSIWKERDINK